jgi:hypothetical protein
MEEVARGALFFAPCAPCGKEKAVAFVAFNANGIARQHYELSKQLQDLHIDVDLLSEIHLKNYERFLISNYRIYRTDRFSGKKRKTAVEVG